jgi:hypothetical protein
LQPPPYLYNGLCHEKKPQSRALQRMLPQRSKGVQKKIKFIGIKFHYICDLGNRYIRICLFPNTLIAQLRIQPPATDSVARYWMGAYTYQAVEIPHYGPCGFIRLSQKKFKTPGELPKLRDVRHNYVNPLIDSGIGMC